MGVRRAGAATPARVRSLSAALGALLALAALTVAPPAQAEPAVTAEGAVLWEPASDERLVDVAADEARPMASTTKIMTALLALEEAGPDETVTVSAEAAATGRAPGAATLRLEEGQELALEHLIAGILLESGNDGAVAIAEHLAGSEEGFVERMNARADEAGLTDTTFLNSSGLTDDPEHAASPADLAELGALAMAEGAFAEIVGQPVIDDPVLGRLDNRNELLDAYEGATGVKTGFTSLAGLCFVASAERDGRTLYAVVLDSEDSFADAAALLDHGFASTRLVRVDGDEPLLRYRWADAEAPLVIEGLAETLPVDAEVVGEATLDASVERPAPAGTSAGELVVTVDGETVATAELQLGSPVEAAAEDRGAGAVGAALADGLRGLARLAPSEVVLD
ncbi:MAG: D-alanyl-D-alanine carboxypeptidase family protein [Egibacteraceae bacterium]